jgi:hypothetical protein
MEASYPFPTVFGRGLVEELPLIAHRPYLVVTDGGPSVALRRPTRRACRRVSVREAGLWSTVVDVRPITDRLIDDVHTRVNEAYAGWEEQG